ncbi:YybS family protein [Paenibacillus pasadenensis]|uniref:DUF2232 domain-containing protein n=1 Tax=Paenibacillus pasadenensis TaxID=217090 RepID=UPI002042143B|nr:DUF2232 domain-containing protein [Paenibacillus pasadenensis]MCM3747930.1 YybS family protein [Paenibacillus pasadenensis]
MKTGGKSIMWSVTALLLLVSIGVPLLNVLTVTLLMVPYVVLYTTLSKKVFAAHLIPVWLIAYFIVGPAPLIVGLFFLVPAIVMGHYYRSDKPVRARMTAVMISIVGIILLELFIFDVVLDLSVIGALQDQLRAAANQVAEQGVSGELWTSEMTDQLVNATVQVIPQALLLSAFMLTAVAQYISRKVLASQGVQVKGLPPAHEWRVPRILVTYYLIVLVIQLFVPANDGSFMATALFNLVPLLRFVFTVQAIGFFFFLAHQKRWPKGVPVIIGVLLLLFPPLSLIGVLDAAFPIRKSFQKP